ncbi:hypothetical protein SMC26_33565 [Actinomadura fulvescens]|uniref:Uncharacterized protein n=1 Tax=Actinomadura fulvescens TaxID=46160 RepID=A0ABP6D1R9_9ACTN
MLLVPGDAERSGEAPAMSVSFACVLSQLDEIAAGCEELVPGCTSGPREMPWNSTELTIITPEHARIVLTAARPLDPDSPQAAELRELGFDIPRA